MGVSVQCVCVFEKGIENSSNLKNIPRHCSQCSSKDTGLLLVDSCFEHDQATETERLGFTHSVISLNIKRENIQSENFIK